MTAADSADVIVVGAGVAGLSVAWALAPYRRVLVLEREAATAYHSSGRSATYYHFGIGNRPVRLLTRASGTFFEQPPEGFSDVPLAHPAPAMMVVRAGQEALFERNLAEMAAITGSAREIDVQEALARVPVLKVDTRAPGSPAVAAEGITRALIDPAAARLDGHALMAGYIAGLRRHGGRVLTEAEVLAVTRHEGGKGGNGGEGGEGSTGRSARWAVRTTRGDFEAPVLVNAAGAWADVLAALAGVAPLGLQPLRRTLIAFDGPAGVDVRGWPLVRSLADEFYFLPESGRVLASPADQTPSPPCDAQPDEYDVALAAWRIEEVTTMRVHRVLHKWAGLRTFTADRVPVAGFATDAPGFFWCAGQGGYGLQTAPALAQAACSLITGQAWPGPLEAAGLAPEALAPSRVQGTPSP